MLKLQEITRKLNVTTGSLCFFSLLGVFAVQSVAENMVGQLNGKTAIIEKIGRLPEIPIDFDNSLGSPLIIETALVKVISGAEYAELTGVSAKANWHSTFPTVIVRNTSSRKITKWGLMIKSVADSPDVSRGVTVNNHPLLPGEGYKVDSTYFLAVLRTTEMRDGKSVSVARIPSYDSTNRWLPGSASDLKIVTNVAGFEEGDRWVMPRNYRFFN